MGDASGAEIKLPKSFSREEGQKLTALKKDVADGKRSDFPPIDKNKLDFIKSIRGTLLEEEGITGHHASETGSASSTEPTTHKPSSVLEEAERVARNRWETSPVPLAQSKTYDSEEQILDKLQKASPAGGIARVDDFSTEPLPTREREQARQLYQDIMHALPNFGFKPNEIDYGTYSPYEREFNVFGRPGKLGIHIGRETEKDDAGNIVREKSKYVTIRGTIPTKKGLQSFLYMIDSNGLATDRVWGKEGTGEIQEDSSENAEELIAKMQADLKPWIEAMTNPSISPEKIKERVLSIRESLVAHFNAQGIVPKTDTKPYHYIPSELVSALEKAAGMEGQERQEQTYQLEVGHEYQIGKIPGMEGEWVVQFETDQNNPVTRTTGRITGKEEIHGQGIIVSKLEYQAPSSNPLEQRQTRYAFWENGDISTPGAAIGYMTGYGPVETDRHDYNPHQALIEAYRLQHALTGAPLPNELAQQKQSKIGNLLKRILPRSK